MSNPALDEDLAKIMADVEKSALTPFGALQAQYLQRDLDAYARILTGTRDLDVIVIFAGKEGRVRIQRRHHAADCRLQQLVVIDRIHVVVFDALQHFGKQLRIVPGEPLPEGRRLVREHAAREAQRQADRDTER